MVEIDLPVDPAGGDRYLHAQSMLDHWQTQGALVREHEPAFWALEQSYVAPDGSQRRRRGLFARVRVTDYGPGRIRPHERTHPGPKEDRLALTRATRANLSPIFSLFPDPDGAAAAALGEATGGDPFATVTDHEGTASSLWRVAAPDAVAALQAAFADAELLIADGHHRYETARVYADEIGGEGDHRYALMFLCSLGDPGLTVFPTHRLLSDLNPSAYEPLGAGLKELFEVEEVPLGQLDPAGQEGLGVFGYADSHLKRGFRLRLRDRAALDRALDGRPDSYRELDAVILEALVLRGILGMSEEDIAAKRGISYEKSAGAARAAIESEDADCAFLLRPTPVEQVRAVAATGETMPPKSTYFFPKVPTGFVFNPLS